MKPGRAETMTHDYKRHGTVDLFAAMNIPAAALMVGQQTAEDAPRDIRPAETSIMR